MKFQHHACHQLDLAGRPPSRGAWIEIAVFFSRRRIFSSRPLAGGVD